MNVKTIAPTTPDDGLAPDSTDPLHDLAHVQKRLRRSRRTLLRWIYAKKLVATKIGGDGGGVPWLVRESEIRRVAAGHQNVD